MEKEWAYSTRMETLKSPKFLNPKNAGTMMYKGKNGV